MFECNLHPIQVVKLIHKVMRTSLLLALLFLSCRPGFANKKPEGLTRINVFAKSFRIYNSVSESGKPGQKPNVLSLRLDFKKPNKEVSIKTDKMVPNLFVMQLNDKNKWETGRIPATVYQDDDGEYIVALRLDNMNRYFEERSKGKWTIEDCKKEIQRLANMNYWQLYLICEWEISDKDHITNDLGFTRTRITPDGFIENAANKGEVELKFHIGELGEVVKLSDIGDKLYLVNKNEVRRLEIIKNVRIEKMGQYYEVAMGAPQLLAFMKKLTGRDVGWNKSTYEEFIWNLQQDWKLYILSKHDKRYDNYNFKDYDISV